jgi:hypothetical protein
MMKGWTVGKLSIGVLGLTVLDVAFTVIGINKGTVVELNPLLGSSMTTSPEITSILTVLYVAALLLLLNRLKGRWIFDLLACVFFVKIGVIMLHLNWMVRI